ncbi:MAG TPA: glycosyltransferase family 39 protein [Vicinamibacterales bacterium]|nr:glycosyltransferase family 39 protein [Vicinamibacterales bacterium]
MPGDQAVLVQDGGVSGVSLLVSRLSSRTQRAIAIAMVLAAMAYLATFVQRGWVAHDEGLIGQSAERVLRGSLPHVDYRDPYTGGLAQFYGAVFRFTGIDLAHVRWVLFIAACFAQVLVYAISRRYLPPIPAALVTWVALVWSFPNYFAGLPSWWILICALLALWALLRHSDTGNIAYVVLAGVSVGIAIVIKQTGVYLLVPLMLSVLSGPTRPHRLLSTALGVSSFAIATLILRSRLGASEFVYLLLPVAASCYMAGSSRFSTQSPSGSRGHWVAPICAALAALVPLTLFLLPYVAAGELNAFVSGAIRDPQKRLVFASSPLPPAVLIIPGAMAAAWLLWSPRSLSRLELRLVGIFRWTVSLSFLWLSFREPLAYTFIWACARGIGALLPVVGLWILIRRRHPGRRTPDLILISSMLAWASLNQFPYSSSAYFCYVAPLAVIAGVASADRIHWPRRLSAAPVIVLALLFGVLSLNRGYVYNIGAYHVVQRLDVRLDLPRAHLTVSADDAHDYHRVVQLIEQHRGARGLVAGPDTPELYFLTGQFSRSGALYDFFSSLSSSAEYAQQFGWFDADVIVVKHRRSFSGPLSSTLLADLRRQYPQSESVGPFEVRWR